jgi:hypothetical protein
LPWSTTAKNEETNEIKPEPKGKQKRDTTAAAHALGPLLPSVRIGVHGRACLSLAHVRPRHSRWAKLPPPALSDSPKKEKGRRGSEAKTPPPKKYDLSSPWGLVCWYYFFLKTYWGIAERNRRERPSTLVSSHTKTTIFPVPIKTQTGHLPFSRLVHRGKVLSVAWSEQQETSHQNNGNVSSLRKTEKEKKKPVSPHHHHLVSHFREQLCTWACVCHQLQL